MFKTPYPKKNLGQHFLVDQQVVKQIVQALELNPSDIAIEIGPGEGVLTAQILPLVKELIGVEKDDQLSELLIEHFGKLSNFTIINDDFLKLELSQFQLQNQGFKVVGNLPYNQSKPILRKVLESELKPKLIVVMLQKEVGEKILDQEKSNLLGLSVGVFAKAEKITSVPATAFRPRPKVDSIVVKLIPHPQPLVDRSQQKAFFSLIKKGFQHPRKKLLNNLLQLTREILAKLKLNENNRPEELSLDQWLRLFQELK
jgi:16S rRNA (adenine1518-N6/adenine1519-N6)-dimethyltransferase